MTLAGLCGEAFERAGRGGDLEVVDFAVNSLSPDGALKLCRAAVELGSSVIVLYVGNNFLRSTPWLEAGTRASTAEALRTGGYPNYHAARREAVSGLARRFRREMEELCAGAGVQVVVVVPAVNLLDWRSPWVAPTWLPEDELADWTATWRRLETAGPEDSADLARRLTELDGAATPRPLEIVGADLVRRGEVDEGLGLLEESVGVGADPANYDRRCPPEVAAELRLLGEAPGFRLVDVPVRSRERFGARAFGRHAFLDYCHHTLESFRLIADDIAGEVLTSVGEPGASGGTRRPWADVPSREIGRGIPAVRAAQPALGPVGGDRRALDGPGGDDRPGERGEPGRLLRHVDAGRQVLARRRPAHRAVAADALVPEELLPPRGAGRRVRRARAARPGARAARPSCGPDWTPYGRAWRSRRRAAWTSWIRSGGSATARPSHPRSSRASGRWSRATPS